MANAAASFVLSMLPVLGATACGGSEGPPDASPPAREVVFTGPCGAGHIVDASLVGPRIVFVCDEEAAGVVSFVQLDPEATSLTTLFNARMRWSGVLVDNLAAFVEVVSDPDGNVVYRLKVVRTDIGISEPSLVLETDSGIGILAVSASHVYFLSNDGVSRAPIAGGPEEVLVPLSLSFAPQASFLVDDAIYAWGFRGNPDGSLGYELVRVSLTDHTVETVIGTQLPPGTPTPWWIGAQAHRLLWTDRIAQPRTWSEIIAVDVTPLPVPRCLPLGGMLAGDIHLQSGGEGPDEKCDSRSGGPMIVATNIVTNEASVFRFSSSFDIDIIGVRDGWVYFWRYAPEGEVVERVRPEAI